MYLVLPLIVWVVPDNTISRQDAKHAKKNLVFHAEATDYQANIIITLRALRLGESNIILCKQTIPTRSGEEPFFNLIDLLYIYNITVSHILNLLAVYRILEATEGTMPIYLPDSSPDFYYIFIPVLMPYHPGGDQGSPGR